MEDEFYREYPFVERHNTLIGQELPNFDEPFYEPCVCVPEGRWRNGEIVSISQMSRDSKIREVKFSAAKDTPLDMIKTREDAKHKNLEKFDPSD